MNLLVVLSLTLMVTLAHAQSLSVRDDLGRRVELAAPAQRVVSLAPHATELLFAVGGGERIVATVEYADFPPAARSIPRIGSGVAPDLERLLAARPDLVVAWDSSLSAGLRQRLATMGIPVFISEPRAPADVPANLRALAHLLGTDAEGEQAARAFEQKVVGLEGDGRPVRTLFVTWQQPLMTLNGEHLISALAGRCGVQNVFAELPQLSAAVTAEAALAAMPELVIVPQGRGEAWRRGSLPASLRAIPVREVDPDLLHRNGPRLVEGVAAVCAGAESIRRGGDETP